jgi:hypothetical protein
MIANCCSRSCQDFGPAQTKCFLTTLILIGAGRSSTNTNTACRYTLEPALVPRRCGRYYKSVG